MIITNKRTFLNKNKTSSSQTNRLYHISNSRECIGSAANNIHLMVVTYMHFKSLTRYLKGPKKSLISYEALFII